MMEMELSAYLTIPVVKETVAGTMKKLVVVVYVVLKMTAA